VLDFGLAKLTGATRQTISGNFEVSQHTTPGMIMGTVAYMSPEQAQGGEVDARTDIWALGVLLYEMAVGKLPFEGPTASHTIVAILEQDPQPFEHPSVELRHIISTALQKDKQLRFQTAEAMSLALDELKHRLGYISDQSISGPAPVNNQTAAKRSGGISKMVWVIPAVFAVLIVGALGVYGVLLLASSLSSVNMSNSSQKNAVPEPTATVETSTATPEPTIGANTAVTVPTPESIYVDPTPAPTVAIIQEHRVVIPTPEKPGPSGVQPTPRVSKPVEVKKPIVKKPGNAQDPNCVFTNSCH
jgi:serine/threonine protein kinase